MGWYSSPFDKKGNEELLENYRPISILPLFGKIFEKVIYSRLHEFLVSNNVICDQQFGFRKGHSTSHALNYSVDEIDKQLSSGKHVMGIFIDLSKAFDKAWNARICTKMHKAGVRGKQQALLNGKQATQILKQWPCPFGLSYSEKRLLHTIIIPS